MKKYQESSKFPSFIPLIFFFQFILFFFYFEKNKHKDNSLLFFLLGILFIGIILLFTRLKLVIDHKYIKYKFSLLPYNKISWDDVSEIRIEELKNSSGWGIKYSKEYGWAYLSDSKFILRIIKKSGKKNSISVVDKEKLDLFLIKNNLL